MVNSSVPIVVLPFISLPFLPRAALAAAARAGSREGSHPAWWQREQAQSLPSFLTPIWPSSEPPTKGNYTTGPDCGCRYCFMAELFQPAPSPAFAHAGTLCSAFNRWRKGTLREINWLPATGLFPVLHCIGQELPPEWDVCLRRVSAPRIANQTLCTTRTADSQTVFQHCASTVVRLLRNRGGILGRNTRKNSSCLLREEKRAVMFILPRS